MEESCEAGFVFGREAFKQRSTAAVGKSESLVEPLTEDVRQCCRGKVGAKLFRRTFL